MATLEQELGNVLTEYNCRSFVGTIVLMTVKNTTLSTKVGLLISYYITLSFWAAQTLALSMISRNIAGQTKKSIVIGTNFVSWAIGNAIGEVLCPLVESSLNMGPPPPPPLPTTAQKNNKKPTPVFFLKRKKLYLILTHVKFLGPQVFLTRDAPRYFTAFSIHLGCYTCLEMVIFFLRWHLKRQNRIKDQLSESETVDGDNDVSAVDGFEDLTDRENIRFRYVY